jgi:hypothetical protein
LYSLAFFENCPRFFAHLARFPHQLFRFTCHRLLVRRFGVALHLL